jgi:hypothetical protein
LRSITAFVVIITSSLLISSLLLLPTNSNSLQSISIPSFGTIQGESAFAKIVTWGDGSTETVKVDNFGQIFLNDTLTVAFGLNIVAIRTSDEDVTSEKVLTTLQDAGVRFMALDIPSWLNVTEGLDWMSFWMPKLYAHRMWVVLYIQQTPNNPPDLNVTSAFARISDIIDGIRNQTWANMIFAVGYNWELDLPNWNFTDAQVEQFLSSLHPLVKEKVDSSMIGAVPIMGKHSATISTFGTVPIIKYSDIPNWDFYYDVNSSDGWQAYYDQRAQVYHQQTLPKAGKGGFHIWFSDTGATSGGLPANDQYSPSMFQYMYKGGGYNDTSAIFLWVLQWYYPYDYSAFDMNGNPNPWFANVLNYYFSNH